ncbi:AAA family ATPase [Nostocoides sp. F2B08]|uniref:LuxR C-terminal-related transcriptional regulator n=1 Tax=Nostocoides sp. F2B08 TaxID=2653936 RepID=UPI001262EDF0|nr:LuxR C-terminal-related transcriptional regulator [Tetrasphaera sp. F2B08]KAB7745664.1 AAA family ATPase [Tetrasphaera sp. F2B08]
MSIASDPDEGGTSAGTASRETQAPESLIGREVELDTLATLLAHGRTSIVNVTGSRGVGKSALVRAALERASSRFAEVAHLDLTGETPVSALAGLRRHVARLPIPARRGDLSSVAERLLLFLDRADVLSRAEQELVDLVPDGPACLVVESVPQLRHPRIAVVQVGPLSLPAAAELFRRRAQATGAALAEDEATTAYIHRVCTAVDANPLAIDLAAARLPFLPLATLATALESPERALAVLSAPRPALSERRALRTGLAASHRSTSAASQRLLDMLSVFSGSFTIEAIEAMWVGDPSECFDALTELIDLRLVQLDDTSGVGRGRLSRLVRDFATERIVGSPVEEEARSRHADHYCHIARRAALAYDDADEDAARAILGEDYPEALAALRWLSDRDPARALRLGADLGWDAHRRGGGAAVVEMLEQLTQSEYAGAESARRDALLWLAQLASWSPLGADRMGLIREQLADALDLARRLEEPLPLLRALRAHFISMVARGDIAASVAACREGIALATAIGHARWLGRFEISLSAVHALVHEYDEAVRLATSGLARATRSDDRPGIALGSLALHVMPADHVPTRAELPALEQVLEIFHAQGDLQNELHTLATLAQEAVDREDARSAAGWVLTRQDRLGRTDLLNGLTVSVMLAVHVARLRGDHTVGARLHGSVSSHMEPLVAVLAPRHVDLYRSGLESFREALGTDDFEMAVAGGRLLDREQTLVELVDYLRSVVDGPAATAAAGRAVASQDDADGAAPSPLSPREGQVLRLLARGLRNKEIAQELAISPKSVMHHTGSIYRRLGVRSRTEAVAAAARLGLVEIGESLD